MSYQIDNVFTPSMIASRPELFFGRHKELQRIEREFARGSVSIQGSVGIGKSSLLSQLLLVMEGFQSNHNSKTILVSAHPEVSSVDEAARMILERFVQVDEQTQSFRVSLLKIVQFESTEAYKNFKDGRHLAVLTQLLEKEFLQTHLNNNEYLIIAIDEADKCPKQLARLVRVLSNNLQQSGMNNVRFVLAGIYPYFKEMTDEDQGVSRLFGMPLHLVTMPEEEANELLASKFQKVQESAVKNGQELEIDPDLAQNIIRLSGGHPHLLQLLGYHLVENEVDNPDNILNLTDLTNALRCICYEDRADYYERMIHLLDINGRLNSFSQLLKKSSSMFPTNIQRSVLEELLSTDDIQWLYSNNYITPVSYDSYGLVDEFLRIRLTMDENPTMVDDIEQDILRPQRFTRPNFNRGDIRRLEIDGFESDDFGRFLDVYEDDDEYDSDYDPYWRH